MSVNKLKAFAASALLCGLCYLAPGLAQSVRGTEQPSVISPSSPAYPPLAVVTGTRGNVVVQVDVEPDGSVSSARTLEGHPLLRKAAEDAALRWRFNAASISTVRPARLEFVFDILLDESTVTADDSRFVPPNRLALVHKIATISALPRVGGRIPDETCPRHGVDLQLDVVPILYGLPESEIRYANVDLVRIVLRAWQALRHRETYFEAERQRFPNSHMHAYGGCIVGSERKAEVLYCRKCRAIEARWRKSHPNRGPAFAAVISPGNSQ